MLVTIDRFIELRYDPGSAPTKRTIQRHIKNGTFKHKTEVQGRITYIEIPDEADRDEDRAADA